MWAEVSSKSVYDFYLLNWLAIFFISMEPNGLLNAIDF